MSTASAFRSIKIQRENERNRKLYQDAVMSQDGY